MDLVYLWCDDADEQWRKKRLKYMKGESAEEQAVCDGRFVQNDELKYSLRSVEKFMPWVRNIYIVSDNQVPKWLNTQHPKITMIRHEQIIDKKYLPLFNSAAIETGLANIPGLSEEFAYMNDDTLLAAPVKLEDFFSEDGKIFVRLHCFKRLKEITQYSYQVLQMQQLIQNKYGRAYPYMPHHNIDVYRKKDYAEAVSLFPQVIAKTLQHRFRSREDWQRSLVGYFMLATERGILRIIDKYKISWTEWLRHNFIMFGRKESIVISLAKKDYQRPLRRYKPKFFCLEDGEKVNEYDRKRGRAFLEKLFPQKSEFEL